MVSGAMLIMETEDAAAEIINKQYAANGDYQGWLVHNYDRKVKEGRAMDTTVEEARAKIEEIKQFRESLGGTNGSF